MFDWFGQNGFHDSIALHCFNVLHTTSSSSSSSSSSIAFSCIQSHSIAISMWILFPTWKKDCVGKLDGFDFPWKQNKQWQRVRNTPFNWLDPDANIFHVSLDDLPILFYESPIFAASMCILFVTVRWFHHLVGPPNSRCWTPSVSLVRELVKSTAHISVLSLNFQSHMINTRINKGPFRVFFYHLQHHQCLFCHSIYQFFPDQVFRGQFWKGKGDCGHIWGKLQPWRVSMGNVPTDGLRHVSKKWVYVGLCSRFSSWTGEIEEVQCSFFVCYKCGYMIYGVRSATDFGRSNPPEKLLHDTICLVMLYWWLYGFVWK